MAKIADHHKRFFFSFAPKGSLTKPIFRELSHIFLQYNKLKMYLLVLKLEDKKQKLFYHFLGLIS